MNNARISFFVFYQNDGTFAEWNVNHKTLGSKGGIFTKESITSSKYKLNGVQAFDNICDSKDPVKVTLSGSCGDGAKAKLRREIKETREPLRFVLNVGSSITPHLIFQLQS